MLDAADVLANVLDDLSFRSSKTTQLAALQHIHTILADVCVGRVTEPRPWTNQLSLFLSLQNDFETNVASRILSSGIVSASVVLRAVDELRSKGTSNRHPASAVAEVTGLALSVLQGMALIHFRSKTYMGRKLSIQTLLDLLTALRHASANPEDPDATVLSSMTATDDTLAASLSPLACSVIDTLLCLLVDSPVALRVFEECNGLEVIVRTLKKVIGQNVRMKCLEFLYFYLQDEEVLAITGTPVVNLPPTHLKSAASSPISTPPITTPAKRRPPQTPHRLRTHQVPATETRARTRPPISRITSQDSTCSVLSSRSRANSETASTRSVSRGSTASHSTAQSNATDAERHFPRTLVMPSLSYSSSTVSSTSTNQTLDPHDSSPQILSRPSTPGRKPSISLSQECLVPLPESPMKSRQNDLEDTPRRPTRTREDTPRAKARIQVGSETAQPVGPPPRLNLFPPPASAGPFGDKCPTATKGLSMLNGEIDYTPVSPKKRRPPKAGTEEDAFAPVRAEPESTPTTRESSPKLTQDPTPKPNPKPTRDRTTLGHRPRTSDILPRPVLVKPGPRNVSTPPSTTPITPSTPTGPMPSKPSTNISYLGTEDSSASTIPAIATPSRVKRAVLPGGMRTPARIGSGSGPGSGEELRRSVGVEELRKGQANGEGLRKSQASKESSPKSRANLEGLKKSQLGAESPRKAGEALRLKKSTSSISVVGRKPDAVAAGEVGRKSVEDGARRTKDGGGEGKRRENFEMESKESTEMELKKSAELETRPSLDDEINALRLSIAANTSGGKMVRSSAEKKELLGAWLGNVDALVEGVQRAGVWGLR